MKPERDPDLEACLLIRFCGFPAESVDEWRVAMPPISVSLDACAVLKSALIQRRLDVISNCWSYLCGHQTIGPFIEAKITNADDTTVGRWTEKVDAYSSASEALAICRAADAIGGK